MHGLLTAHGNCVVLDCNLFKPHLCSLRFGARLHMGPDVTPSPLKSTWDSSWMIYGT